MTARAAHAAAYRCCEWRVQPAEPFRLYRPLPEQRNGNGDEQRYAAPLNAALEAELSALKQLNQMLRDQLDDTRGQRDKWEQAAQMALRQLTLTFNAARKASARPSFCAYPLPKCIVG
jgi:hypothetical protein